MVQAQRPGTETGDWMAAAAVGTPAAMGMRCGANGSGWGVGNGMIRGALQFAGLMDAGGAVCVSVLWQGCDLGNRIEYSILGGEVGSRCACVGAVDGGAGSSGEIQCVGQRMEKWARSEGRCEWWEGGTETG